MLWVTTIRCSDAARLAAARLIPLLLDAQAAEPMVAGLRLQEFQPSPDGPVLCGREG